MVLKKHKWSFISVAWVAYMAGQVSTAPGTTPSCERFEWWIVPLLLCFILIPMCLGYLSAKEDK